MAETGRRARAKSPRARLRLSSCRDSPRTLATSEARRLGAAFPRLITRRAGRPQEGWLSILGLDCVGVASPRGRDAASASCAVEEAVRLWLSSARRSQTGPSSRLERDAGRGGGRLSPLHARRRGRHSLADLYRNLGHGGRLDHVGGGAGGCERWPRPRRGPGRGGDAI